MMLGQRADQDAIDEINRELGLDKGIFYQYGLYLNDLSPISYHSAIESDASFYEAEKYGGAKVLATVQFDIVFKAPYLRKSYQSKKKRYWPWHLF